MTKPQIWVAVFLVLFIALFMLGRLTKERVTPQHPTGMPQGQSQSNLSGEDLTATELFVKWACVTCHGSDLNGTVQGPSLRGVSRHWGRDMLINYLRNPSSFMNSDRLKAYNQQYPGIIMPSYSHVDVKDLGKMVDYLLGL